MSSFYRLLGYIRNYRGLVTLNVLSNILTAVFTVVSIPLLIPFLEVLFDRTEPATEAVQWAWDAQTARQYFGYQFSQLIAEQGKETALIYVCSAILIVFFLKNLFRYLSLFFMAPVRNGIVRDLRANIFDKLLILPLGYFSEEKKGDLLSRVTADVQEVEWSILNVLEAIFREPLIVIGSLSFMVYVSPQLTGFVFALMLFTGVVIGGIGRSLRKPSGAVQTYLGKIVSTVEEGLGGLRIIKGFNAEGYQREKFAKDNNAYRWSLTHLLWRKDLASPLSEFLGIATVAVLLWYGSRQVFAADLDAETFLTFIYAFYNVIDPAKNFSRAFYNIQKGIAALQRVEEVLDAPLQISDAPNAKSISHFESAIRYESVSFRYSENEPLVLDNIQLDIPKGKVVALVGSSGAGKSTLVDLLPRFYDVTQGKITVDGTDIRELSLQSLRGLLGIVSQEAVLFNDSIYNNICFGRTDVSEAEVIRAAKIAHANDFILATEKGYQTNVGDRGTKLSGGQRQRITLARAVLADPPILILDEATSALDSESEKAVQEALVDLMQGRTALVIAHRLSTIQHADEIIVMEQGKIVERGTHQALLDQGGSYSKLVALQHL